MVHRKDTRFDTEILKFHELSHLFGVYGEFDMCKRVRKGYLSCTQSSEVKTLSLYPKKRKVIFIFELNKINK